MSNVAIFVAHEGCRHCCSFCDQHVISGSTGRVSGEEVRRILEKALENPQHRENQIAFFGGSFTAIERDYMAELLEATVPFREAFNGIRISTRPDAVDAEILSFLKGYGVQAIELGAQSMDDEVLRLNRRGHSAADVVRASKMIRDAGFELGLQMMTGLYGDSEKKALQTARALIALHPATVRIYPTVVLEGTELAELYRQGVYQAQSLEEAVALCVKLIPLFEEAGVRIIRLGLHESEQVASRRVAGAYHPAFRELCLSRIYYEKAMDLLSKQEKGEYTLNVAPAALSQMIGQHKENLHRFAAAGYQVKVRSSAALGRYEIQIEEKDRTCI